MLKIHMFEWVMGALLHSDHYKENAYSVVGFRVTESRQSMLYKSTCKSSQHLIESMCSPVSILLASPS